eukprot:symbB.v1.2.037105.t1/scaffold5389.1/size27643/2
MQVFFSTLFFPAPSPSYSATSFPGELLWIPPSLDYGNCRNHSWLKASGGIRLLCLRQGKRGTALPSILLNCPHARYFVLFLHSNGEDIGMCHTFACRLRDLLEFPGYGLCPGKPSEDSLDSAADVCFRYVREVLQVAPADIIVMGRSMGAAVALSLAEKFYFGGLVLIAPFLSLRDALGQYTGAKMSEVMLDELFCSKEKIKSVKVPTLVIHGQKDRLIDSSQGKQLYDLCESRKKLFVCPEELGHNDDLLSDPEFLIRPILRFFPLPDYYFTTLRVPKEARSGPVISHAVPMVGNSGRVAMVSTWPEVSAFLFLDCGDILRSLLADPLDWRALQSACHWRGAASPSLLAKVHQEPKLRLVIKETCQKLRGLPLNDLFGERIRAANLTDDEMRYMVEILGAMPNATVRQARHLDLRFSFPSLNASQGFALGCWLQRFDGDSLRLAECGGLLKGPGIGNVLRGLGSCQLQLKHLDLCATQLSKVEAPALSKLLSSFQLETLNLAFNERLMTCEALQGLADALEGEKCVLSELVLKHCNVSGKAGQPLGLWLRHMPCLRELNLNWNPEILSSRGLRGLFDGLSSCELALQRLQMRGSEPDQAAEVALRDILQRHPTLTLDVDRSKSSGSVSSASERHPKSRKQRHVVGWEPAVTLLSLMRLPDFREQLRSFLPGPLEWRALQCSWRWTTNGSAGPLQEVHRRPGLRSSAARLRRRLKGKPLQDLFSMVKCSDEELRFAIELMGARPRQVPVGRVSEIQRLDLSYEHLPPGMALGIFLKYCSHLEELRLEGNAQLCSATGLQGLLSGLGNHCLQLRTLLFGGCGVAEQAAPYLGRFLKLCPKLTALSLSGSRNLCTADGLQGLLQSWAGEGIPLKQLILKNCALDKSSAEALGQLLRRCHYLEDLALFQAPALILLLRGLEDEGFPYLTNLTLGNLFDIDEAAGEVSWFSIAMLIYGAGQRADRKPNRCGCKNKKKEKKKNEKKA